MGTDRKALAAEALRFARRPDDGVSNEPRVAGLAVLFDVVANDALEDAAVAIEREAESPEHAAQIVRAMKAAPGADGGKGGG